ncbi:hypothetical protein D9M72_107850 [compost metagenome]
MILTNNVRKQSLARGSQVRGGTGRRDKSTRKLVVTLICNLFSSCCTLVSLIRSLTMA